MTAKLNALQNQMQTLLNEAKILADSPSTDESRMEALTSEMQDLQQEITRVKSFENAITNANSYLNEPAALSSLSGSKGVTNDPEAMKAKMDDVKVRGRAPHFELVGFDRQAAALQSYRFGMSVMASLKRDPRAIKYCKDHGIGAFGPGGLMAVSGQTESVNEDGGFLVLPEFDDSMIVLREAYGIFRARCRNSVMSSDTKSRIRRVGGVTAYFIEEENSITSSKAGWDRVNLTARKLAALTYASNEFNEDSMVDFGDTIAGEMAYAFAKKEDDCGINGDGTSTYGRITGVRQRFLDVFTSSGGTGLIVAAGNTFASITLGNLEDVDGALPQFAETPNVAWYCHKKFWSSVMQRLALASGGVTAREVVDGSDRKFLGHPVVISQQMPSTATASTVPCFLGDLSLAADFGDRRQTTIALSEHDAFASDQLAIRGTERFDINVHDIGATGVAGPIVGLVLTA